MVLGAAIVLGACSRPPEPPPAPPEPAPAIPAAYRTLDPVADGGRVEGVVRLTGVVPKLRPRPVTRDAAACGAADHPNLSLLVGDGGTVRNAVVSLLGVSAGKKPGTLRPELDQRGCEYVPYLQVVPIGASLLVRNSDPVSHNVHAWDARSETLFNVGTAVQGMTFDQPLTVAGPVKVKCDVHPWMFAWLWVAETPYAVVTDEKGRFALSDVPPGTYTARVWHELLAERRVSVTVPPSATARLDVELSVGP